METNQECQGTVIAPLIPATSVAGGQTAHMHPLPSKPINVKL